MYVSIFIYSYILILYIYESIYRYYIFILYIYINMFIYLYIHTHLYILYINTIHLYISASMLYIYIIHCIRIYKLTDLRGAADRLTADCRLPHTCRSADRVREAPGGTEAQTPCFSTGPLAVRGTRGIRTEVGRSAAMKQQLCS